MTSPAVYAKALVAACTSLTGALVTAASDGKITPVELVIVGATVVGAAAATYVVPNRDDGAHGDQSVQDEPVDVEDPVDDEPETLLDREQADRMV